MTSETETPENKVFDTSALKFGLTALGICIAFVTAITVIPNWDSIFAKKQVVVTCSGGPYSQTCTAKEVAEEEAP